MVVLLNSIDLNKSSDKKLYKQEMEVLEIRLVELQQLLIQHNIPLLILFEGWSSSGKGTQIAKITNPLDPRFFNVYAMNKLSEENLLRPFLYSFYTKLPSVGRIAILDKSWNRLILPQTAEKWQLTEKERDNFYYDVSAFEQQIIDSGILVVKFFLHISKDEQKRRFKELTKNKSTNWRVDAADMDQNKNYEKWQLLFDKMLQKSDESNAKWTIVEANDKNYAATKIYKILISKIEEELNHKLANKNQSNQIFIPTMLIPQTSVLSAIDLDKTIDDGGYKEKLNFYQKKLIQLEYKLYTKRRSVIIVYEGWDAAGKGGNIKRLTQELDPRGYEVIPIAAPTKEELNHHYLWRFWKKCPKDGHIAIFDRSWYGRVLVERIEGFCSVDEWQRAYKEINDMERHIYNNDTLIFKFWIHIDKEEQLKRFNERQENVLKQYKINSEDWRNREKWDQYETAVNEMLLKTNTDHAPWLIVESKDKRYARIKTLEYVVDCLEKSI